MSSTGVCSHCGCTDIDSDPARGDAVCTNCGSVLEDQIIVSEIQFEDNAGGGSSVIGQFVSSDGSKPHSLGINFPHGIKRESRTVTYENGRRSIQQVGSQLRLNQHCIDTAFNFFKMAVNKRLTRGRKTTHVIAACLYLVCRTEGTPHMLLDFSDILQVNVYSLGRTYLQLSKELCISIPAIDPCLYIPRFAHKLELGDKTHEVSMTAMRLVQRMKRDWMHTGRRPSGLCGAALLVASRMHEFSRSVRQIIKVAKVCDTTIRKRLSEFKATPSSQLTIEEFQTVDLEEEQDPPAFTASKRKAQEAKFHAQLDKFPELESEVELIKEQIEKSMVPPKPVGIYAAYAKMAASPLGDNEEVSRVSTFLEEETFKEAISDIDNISETTTNNPVSYSTLRPTAASLGIKEVLSECLKESDSERDDGELDLHGIDDEELDKFLLSDDEIKLKTSIWMAENSDYLKALEEKELRLAKEKEEEEKNPDKKKHRKRKKKPPSMGPAASAEEAIVRLLHEKKISNKINYEVLNDLKFTGVNRSPSKETTSSATVIPNGEPVINRFSKTTSRLRPENSGKISQNLSSKRLKLDENSEKETAKDLEVIVESGPVDYGPDDKEDEDEDDLVDEDEGCLSAAQLLGHSTDINYDEDVDIYDVDDD
ncbi:transcription factor IIIB 90 kDa subunit-like [Mytilus californianus]|uniref:transcription factor IIIB 90 kDa subunit-like n=1 Tax=Mytilus californianus TaxID=6549 RepID=UPI00224786C6|nr:transcription factor IIIB 90 kDa subunit-like [Mytilus californianus]